MDYMDKAFELQRELRSIELEISTGTKTDINNYKLMPYATKQTLLDKLSKVENEVKQEETYSKGTLAAGILLLVLITSILIALMAIFAPIISLPIAIVLLVLLSTAFVGGITTLIIAVARLFEAKKFFSRIADLRNKFTDITTTQIPPPTEQEKKHLQNVHEWWLAKQTSRPEI